MTVAVHSLRKTYGRGETAVHALRGINLRIESAQFTAIMGPSGSGKSTLMHILAGLDTAETGSIKLDGIELSDQKEKSLTKIRRERIGFIFQAFNLVPAMTAKENILLPSKLAKQKIDPEFFDSIVSRLGLSDRLDHRPHELSGGQQQRVAVARALVSRPSVIFADEPTGNLDSVSGAEVLEILRDSVDELGQTVVMVTHDPAAAVRADRVVLLADGHIVGDYESPSAETISRALLDAAQ